MQATSKIASPSCSRRSPARHFERSGPIFSFRFAPAKRSARAERNLSFALVSRDKQHPTPEEEKYAAVLLTLIETYEEEHHSIPDASPVEVLRALMEAHNLRQKDLVPIFGSESIVSEVLLHKKRALNKTHIARLNKRFHVSPAVFF